MSFEEWKEDFGINCSKYSVEYYTLECAYKAGAASRQGYIDELQEANLNLDGECVKLQKRIDELTKWSEFHIEDYNLIESESDHDRGWFNAACQVFKILKGESNEN